MKLWRRLAKKELTGDFDSITNIHTGEVLARIPVKKRNGREIRYQLYISEQISKTQKRSTDLLDALIDRAGIKFIMTKKEQNRLKEMIEQVSKTNEEQVNETK